MSTDFRNNRFRSGTAAANNPVTVTLAGKPGRRYRITVCAVSYLGGTPSGTVTITGIDADKQADGATFFDYVQAINGQGHRSVGVGLVSRENTDLVVTLAAGGASAVGRVNLQAIEEPFNT